MKKGIGIVIIGLGIVLSLAGCGANAEPDGSGKQQNSTSSQIQDDTATQTDKDSEVLASGDENSGVAEATNAGDAQDANANETDLSTQLVGTWRTTELKDENGNPRCLYLIMDQEGYCGCWINDPLKISNGILEFYEGSYYVTDDTSKDGYPKGATVMNLNMVGGQKANEMMPRTLTCVYDIFQNVSAKTVALNCKYLSGDSLMGAGTQATFELTSYQGGMTDVVTLPVDDVTQSDVQEYLNGSGVNGLLWSRFTAGDTVKISLLDVVYQVIDDDISYDDVDRILTANGEDLYTDVSYISAGNLDKFLIENTGYSLYEGDWDITSPGYIPKLNTYYVMHGDTNYIPIEVLSIEQNGDRLLVTCDSEYDMDNGKFLVELEKNAAGNFRIISIQSEKNNKDKDYVTIDSRYISFKIPSSWEKNCEHISGYDESGVYYDQFYEIPDYYSSYGGWICSILQVEGNDVNLYCSEPNFRYLGEIILENQSKVGLVIVFPSDVQASDENEYLYAEMCQALEDVFDSIRTRQGAFYKDQGGIYEFVCYESTFVFLSEYELAGLSAWELKVARNEIYARHGRMFNDKTLQEYFDSCSWYKGTIKPADFDESVLSECELENLKFIREYEKKMVY